MLASPNEMASYPYNSFGVQNLCNKWWWRRCWWSLPKSCVLWARIAGLYALLTSESMSNFCAIKLRFLCSSYVPVKLHTKRCYLCLLCTHSQLQASNLRIVEHFWAKFNWPKHTIVESLFHFKVHCTMRPIRFRSVKACRQTLLHVQNVMFVIRFMVYYI